MGSAPLCEANGQAGISMYRYQGDVFTVAEKEVQSSFKEKQQGPIGTLMCEESVFGQNAG